MVVRILAVDDEPDILGALADAWEQEELELVCAGSAEEALKVLGAAAFDVLLTDFKMPGGDGLDLIQQVTAQQPSVRCYLMTAFPDSALKDLSLIHI